MLKIVATIFIISFLAQNATGQLTVHQSDLIIQSGGVITVQGDMSSTKDISSYGKIVFNGSDSQSVNMNGKSFYNVEINNPKHVYLKGDAGATNSLLFTNGKIIDSNYNFTLGNIAVAGGMGKNKFIETKGTGIVYKNILFDLQSNEIPVGGDSVYRPVYLTTSGSYASAKVGVQFLDSVSSNRPFNTSDYLEENWNIFQSGITGTLQADAKYNDANIFGQEKNLKAYLFDGTDWNSSSGSIDTVANRLSFPITTSSANITAIDKFVLLKSKVFLQGAYDVNSGLMRDNLRSNSLLPLSDPYRSTPYSGMFVSVNDPLSESVASSVFANQTDGSKNIVDWVFLELRDGSNGNSVLETRSALVQKNGEIVETDGESPVVFNNVTSGQYTLAIRHRNHLGISTDPATYLPALDEKYSTVSLVDFSTNTHIFGGTAAYAVAADNNNLMWAGNSNMNEAVKFTGPGNDKDEILNNALGGDGTAQLTGYYPADLNMDGIIKYSGPKNDKDFLLSYILLSAAGTILTQYLP